MHSKTKHIPALFVVAVLAAAGLGYAFASGGTFINPSGGNVVKGSLTLEDKNGVPITGTLSPFQTVKQNDVDVTNHVLRVRLQTSFSIASDAPVQQWTITGLGAVRVNGETSKPIYINMQGTSASENNMDLLIRDCSSCSEPYETSLAIPVLELVSTKPNTYTGPIEVELYLQQLKIDVTSTDGSSAIAYATPPTGVVLTTMSLYQEGDPVAPTTSVNSFTVTSGSAELEEQ